MMDEFLLRALIVGVAVAVLAGPLGAFVVWRRMAYFGGTLSHTALLGVSLGFLLGIEPFFGVAGVVLAAAFLLSGIHSVRGMSLDTILGVLAHASLALGLIVASLLDTVRLDLMGYLFGDILAVGWDEVAWVSIGAAICLAVVIKLWRALLNVTVHADLAAVEGFDVRKLDLALMVMLAVLVALAMQVVGILLVTSLLIVPAAAARSFSRTPEHMAFGGAVLGVVSVLLGLWASLISDIPAGPAIVGVASIAFAASLFVKRD